MNYADDQFIDAAREEAALQRRSLANQITHWAKIGHAIERAGALDYAKLSSALSGELDTTELSAIEEAVWLEQFMEKLSEPGPGEEAFFRKRRASGNGVGLDNAGNIIQELDRKRSSVDGM